MADGRKINMADESAKNAVTTAIEAAAEAMKASKIQWDKLDVGIEHSGRAITLPGDPGKMPLEKAVEAIQRKIADENQDFQLHEIVEGHPLDAAVAFVKAMQSLYGWASPVPTPGFFGPKPPQMLSIKTGHRREDVVQCPIGGFKLPGVDRAVETLIWNQSDKHGRHEQVFLIHGKFKKKERHILLELANEARRIVREQSIYRGKAIRLSVSDDGILNTSYPPEFMDVSDTAEDALIFDEDIQAMIDTNILVPIKHTVECKKNKIPVKRGVLLEGPYGTGKSLTARMTANVCEQNGWTFVLLDKVQGLQTALEFANRYSPAVVFAEDIDRIATVRDESANDLINTIDGVVSKKSEVMVILTTNFAENLNPVILRPGRFDAVISLRAPSDKAVQMLLRKYAGKLLPDGIELPKAGKALSGQIPATVRECVDRAKLGMIGRGAKQLSDEDLYIAAETMKNHLSLLNRKIAEESEADKLARALRNVVSGTVKPNTQEQTVHQVLARITETVDNIYETVN